MNDWYSLGVALRVHPNKLQEIQKSSPQEGIQRWKIDLLQHWLKSTTNASWSTILTALEKIGHRVLADQLRAKYLVPQTTAGILCICAYPTMASTVHCMCLSKQVCFSRQLMKLIFNSCFADKSNVSTTSPHYCVCSTHGVS